MTRGTMRPMTFHGLALLLLFVSSADTAVYTDVHARTTCQSILVEDPGAPSGMYTIRVNGRNLVEVYCEMGLNGGGYTFLHPSSLSSLAAKDVTEMFRDTKSFLLRVRSTNGAQPYGVLSQLPEYAGLPLKLGLAEYEGYNPPVNLNIIPGPFLYYGFLSKANANNNNVQGISVNGVRIVFTNCDRNPNSQFTLFPNFREVPPSTYHVPSQFCSNIFKNLLPNPSARVMPADMFMFGEMHFGGCGCYSQTNRLPDVLSIAIGFR